MGTVKVNQIYQAIRYPANKLRILGRRSSYTDYPSWNAEIIGAERPQFLGTESIVSESELKKHWVVITNKPDWEL